MPINYPVNRNEVADRIKTDIQNLLPELEPFLRDSYICALATADAGRVYDLYVAIKALQNEMFPDTADGSYLDRWGNYKGLARNQATTASGYITASGIAGTVILNTSLLQSTVGISYQVTGTVAISSQTLIVASIIRSGSVATVTTSSEHELATGTIVAIANCEQTEYNITATITVTGITTFTYLVTGNPVTPATTLATINALVTVASLPIKSLDYGSNTNLESGNELFFTTPIAGVNSSAYVQYGGIKGGTDLETDDQYRARILYAYQHPISYFNDAELVTLCETIGFVTRVFVQDTTPEVGQVTIYFVCDKQFSAENPTAIIPNGDQVAQVYELVKTIKPAHVAEGDIIVAAPVPYVVDFSFSQLNPNNNSMQLAIEASLQNMFAEIPSVGVNLPKYAYESAIFQTVDPSTGVQVTSFTLINPVVDIIVTSNQLPVLGNIDFSNV